MESVKRPGSRQFSPASRFPASAPAAGPACAAVTALGGLLWLSACGPMVANAPFSARPETLEGGDLLGPFEGTVVDAESERPIEGALVFASWAFERGVGLVGPMGAFQAEQETTSDGHYAVGRLEDLPSGASARVARFTLVVYKRGYVAWRSDGIFPEGARRRDFSQRANRVRLAKWAPEQSHARHLVFLGGGSSVQRMAAWEREPASLEMEGRKPLPAGGVSVDRSSPSGGPTLLDATPLLTETEIRGVTGFAGEFERTRLQDLPRTEFYDTAHFAAKDQPEAFDVALRLWRLGEGAAEEQYRALLAALPEPEARDEIGDTSVRVRAAGARALVFLIRERGLIGSITCGESQCPEAPMIVRLGKLVESRLDRVADLPTEATPPPAPVNPFTEPGATP